MKFPRDRGTQVKKSWKFQGMGEVPETTVAWKILGGGSNSKKNPP